MKKRKSFIFGKYLEKKRTLKIVTKFPKKWILIDTENGDFYNGTEDERIGKQWKKINDNNLIIKIIEKLRETINMLNK